MRCISGEVETIAEMLISITCSVCFSCPAHPDARAGTKWGMRGVGARRRPAHAPENVPETSMTLETGSPERLTPSASICDGVVKISFESVAEGDVTG